MRSTPLRRLKHVVTLVADKQSFSTGDGPYIGLEHIQSWTGIIDLQSEVEPDGTVSRFKANDVLFGKLRPYLAKVVLAPTSGVASTEALVLRAGADAWPPYLRYVLVERGFIDKVTASTFGAQMPRASWEFIGTQQIPMPSHTDQKAIAEFLDHETARIDQMIAKKERMIAVVDEQRNATISLAVTQGLDRDSSLRETSSPYLPLIPESWSIQRLKQLAVVRGGITLGRELPPGLPVVETPYLRVANVQAGRLDLGVVTSLQATESEIKRYSLRPSDVLMNEGGDNDKLGRGAVWDGSINPCLHQNHVFAVRPHDPENAPWIALASNSRYGRDFFYLHSKQSTNLASISKSRLEQFPIALPQPQERNRILNMLETEFRRTDSLIESITLTIYRLRELRSALITAAVTGQIDVTTWRRGGHTERQLEAIARDEDAARPGSAPDA